MPKVVKELVEIIGENGIKKRKKYPVKANKVLIEPPKKRGRGHAGWMPKYTRDSFLYYVAGTFPFRRIKRKLMVWDGATKCIEFKGKDNIEIPVFDKEALKTLFEANVIKSAGETTLKVTIPVWVYLLLCIIIMLSIVSILVASGRVYF